MAASDPRSAADPADAPEASGDADRHDGRDAAGDDALRRSDDRAAHPPRRRRTSIAILALGGLVAGYFATQGPRPQHVRVVLGAEAPHVTAVDLQYVTEDGDVAREAHFAYDPGAAPRVVAHEPRLPNGEYHVQIDLDARGGRREVRRQVTLGGGSTQIDVSSALSSREREVERPPEPAIP